MGLAGFSIEKYESDGLGASGSGFPDDQVLTNLNSAAKKNSISSSYSSNTLASFLSRLEYKFNNRYLLTLNFRADGSSQFGPDKRWGYFPSGGHCLDHYRRKFHERLCEHCFLSEIKRIDW